MDIAGERVSTTMLFNAEKEASHCCPTYAVTDENSIDFSWAVFEKLQASPLA
jgi:hypothetical protein